MACTASETKLKGFFLQTIEANLSIGITDIFSDPIPGAIVTLDIGYDLDLDLSNTKGIVKFNLPTDIEAHLTVAKDLYHLYESDIVAVQTNLLSEGVNFPFLLKSSSNGLFVGSPTARLAYCVREKNELDEWEEVEKDHIDVVANEDNIYGGVFRFGYINKLEVTDTTHGDYSKSIETFLKIEIENTGYKVVPIIQLV